jgi:hypothetical protein
VKLSRTRVDELVSCGAGERFDPGHGRVMKDWIVGAGESDSVGFASEAYQFVKGTGY